METDYIYLAPEPLTTNTFPMCKCGITFRNREELREHIGRWAVSWPTEDWPGRDGKEREWPLRHMMVL